MEEGTPPPKPDRRKKKLSEKGKKFVREYIKTLNATKAAKAAGFAPGGSTEAAAVEGARLLRNPKVYKAVQDAIAKRAARVELTADRVIQETKALGLSDVSHYMVDEIGRLVLAPGAPPNAMAAVSSVKYRTITDKEGNVTREVEFKLWDKPGTLKLLGKHTGTPGFAEKVELSGPNGGPIATSMTVEEARRAIEEIEAKVADKGPKP